MALKMLNLAALLALLSSMAGASEIDVVVAHYNEDLSWLSMIPENVHVHIYTKGPQLESTHGHIGGAHTTRQPLPNVGRESHTYLSHIVKNYDNLAPWTVFTQAGAPSFGYKGHRSGGGHLLAGDSFVNYLTPHSSGSRFVYTSVVHLPSMNHLLRAAYCIEDEMLEGGAVESCPTEASQWTPWWDVGGFRNFVDSKVKSQHGEFIMDFYRKYINPSHAGEEVTAFFPQGARFAVSRETIHRRPKVDYERLLAVLSNDEDSYAGYFMEWLWAELFLGHQEPCTVPDKAMPIGHAEAMHSLTVRFPNSVERHVQSARSLTATSVSGSPGCICGGISGGISAPIWGSSISAGISGAVSGIPCVCGGISSGISGGISGGLRGSTATTTTTTTVAAAQGKLMKVAGKMEVEIIVSGAMNQTVVEDMFRRAISKALDVAAEDIVKLAVVGISTGSRRLQSNQTMRYEVSYEVLVPSSLDAAVVVAKANRIADAGSAESLVFQQVLTDTNGVAGVRNIEMKEPASVYEVTTTTVATNIGHVKKDSDENKRWRALVVGGVTILVVLICLITSAILIKRKRNPAGDEKASSQGADERNTLAVDGLILPESEDMKTSV
jgi:hypothetical protein